MASLLWLYAIATGLFAMANVFVNYHLSTGKSLGTWLALGAGIAQVVLLVLVHNSLQQVIVAQIVLMGTLLVTLVLWDVWLSRRPSETLIPIEASSSA
jgi:hypothetical protein